MPSSTLEDVLRQHNIHFRIGGEHRHVRSGWVGIDCPYCSTQGKYHLGINRSNHMTSCWKCGPHSLVDALAKLLNVSIGAARQIASSIGWTPRQQETKERQQLKLPNGINELIKPHRDYLLDRKFDPTELVKLWQIQGIGLASRLSWRIWIPIRFRDNVVSWTTRAIGDAVELRYINAGPTEESMSPKQILYGLDYVRSSVVICEGPTDAWRIGPGAVAMMGLQYTQAQVAWMAKIPNRFVCFDNSTDAQSRARRLVDQLSLLPGNTHQLMLDADDPGSASKREVAMVRRTVFGD